MAGKIATTALSSPMLLSSWDPRKGSEFSWSYGLDRNELSLFLRRVRQFGNVLAAFTRITRHFGWGWKIRRTGHHFAQDGVQSHFSLEVRAFLNERFTGWICRGSCIAWPPRSPDLTAMTLKFRAWLRTGFSYIQSQTSKISKIGKQSSSISSMTSRCSPILLIRSKNVI